MNKLFQKWLGVSWKTTLIGYVFAILVALQPLLDTQVDFSNRYDFWKYCLRLVFAALIAAFGKYAADSRQVKDVDAKVHEAADKAGVRLKGDNTGIS